MNTASMESRITGENCLASDAARAEICDLYWDAGDVTETRRNSPETGYVSQTPNEAIIVHVMVTPLAMVEQDYDWYG